MRHAFLRTATPHPRRTISDIDKDIKIVVADIVHGTGEDTADRLYYLTKERGDRFKSALLRRLPS